jgi:hypothetical protein
MLTRKGYDAFINKLTVSFDDHNGLFMNDKVSPFNDDIWPPILIGFVLLFLALTLAAYFSGLSAFLYSYIGSYILIYAGHLIISLLVSTKVVQLLATRWWSIPIRHWWWSPFAYLVNYEKVFGSNRCYRTTDYYHESARLEELDKFLQENEPDLGLWYIHHKRTDTRKVFFLRKKDVFYLKLKYYQPYDTERKE